MKRYLLLSLLLFPATLTFASLPEPDTVFYGRVIHQGGGEEYVMTSGELRWTVAPPSTGSPAQVSFEASVSLEPMQNGAMSYQLRIPTRLAVAGVFLPFFPGLTIGEEPGALPFKNTTVTLNGRKLRMADPAGLGFDPSSVTRGAFRRLDFIDDGQLPDADGDGLPDWWEEKYGTGMHVADAVADSDGDGVTNIEEYRRGTDPSGADQNPRLPEEFIVSLPPGGRAIPVIQAIDADSKTDQMTYTIADMPVGFTLALLDTNANMPAVTRFSQADVNAGRLVISHDAAIPLPENLTVGITLRDETESHPAATSTMRFSIAAANLLWESWGLSPATMPNELPAIQDASRYGNATTLRSPSGHFALNSTLTPTTTKDISRLFLGTPAADTILGSAKDDYIVAHAGDSVRAGTGADRILLAGGSGLVTVNDFSLTENDVIDLRGLLKPVSGRRLSAYVNLTGTDLRIDADGDGSGFTDLTVRLTNADLPVDVADLWNSGNLETGDITPETTIFLITSGQASEEGLTTAAFNLRRRGSDASALTIPLTWSGTAIAGKDYSTLPASVTFPVGSKTAALTVLPLADDEREVTETIQIVLGTNPAWAIAEGSAKATVTLLDLPNRVWLEVAERTAFKDSLSPAQVIVRRSGSLTAPLTAQFIVTGRATAAVDYRRLPSSVSFAVNQDTLTLDVMPLSSATLSRRAEDVTIAVRSDANYLFGATPVARVMIVDRPRTFADWKATHEVSADANEFLRSDHDGDGISGLAEFAFGRNPKIPDHLPTTLKQETDGRVSVEFHRWPGAPELRYYLESSNSMHQWAEVPQVECEEIESEILTDGRERIRMAMKKKSIGTQFFRVAVTTNIE